MNEAIEQRGGVADGGPRRMAVLALSLVGAAAMGASSLLQLGIVKDLPDPKARLFGMPFRSRKVNLSDDAYVLGLRDAPIAFAGFAANIPFLLALGRARPSRKPWLSLAFAAKTFAEAVGAVAFFTKMPRKEKAWCAYCVAGAVASVSIFALSLPEAVRAFRTVSPWRKPDAGGRAG